LDTGRSSGPELMPASAVHSCMARTGQRAGLGPKGSTTSSGLAPSWFVLERGMLSTSPLSWSAKFQVYGDELGSAQGTDEADQ